MSTLAERIKAKQKELKNSKARDTVIESQPVLVKPASEIQAIDASGSKEIVSRISTQTNTQEAKTNPLLNSQSRPTYREGKRNIAAYHPEPVHRQFKVLAAEKGVTVQELHRQALNLLFAEHEKPTIA